MEAHGGSRSSAKRVDSEKGVCGARASDRGARWTGGSAWGKRLARGSGEASSSAIAREGGLRSGEPLFERGIPLPWKHDSVREKQGVGNGGDSVSLYRDWKWLATAMQGVDTPSSSAFKRDLCALLLAPVLASTKCDAQTEYTKRNHKKHSRNGDCSNESNRGGPRASRRGCSLSRRRKGASGWRANYNDRLKGASSDATVARCRIQERSQYY